MTSTYQPAGIEYVRVVGMPTKDSPFGPVVSAACLKQAERLVASAIIRLRFPLRGVEVQYIRRVLGLSQAALGRELGPSDVAVLKWEKRVERRLDTVNEVALRALFAERLGVPLPGTLSDLCGADEVPSEVLELQAAS